MKSSLFDSVNLVDLHRFLDATSGPYASVLLPARSDVDDATQLFESAWKRVRNDVKDRWSDTVLDHAEQTVHDAGHARGDSMAIVVPTVGVPLVEHLVGSPASIQKLEGPLPAFTPIIEHRQRTIAHLVVECDKAGADIVAFDGGTPLTSDRVDGDELHIHRGHPGGWSQRRFQQRAENTWTANIGEVADAVKDLAAQVGARFVAVAGPTRAQSMLVKALDERSLDASTIALEAGDVDGIADEVVKLTEDVHARAVVTISEQFRERESHGMATANRSDVLDALAGGRVESLLVVDDWSDGTALGRSLGSSPNETRAIDAAIAAALATDAGIAVVPHLATLDGPLGATLRW